MAARGEISIACNYSLLVESGDPSVGRILKTSEILARSRTRKSYPTDGSCTKASKANKTEKNMHTIRRRFALFISLLVASLLIASPTTTRAQSETDYYAAAGPGGDEYPDYGDDPYSQQDNLYADYAAHQQEKLTGGGGG